MILKPSGCIPKCYLQAFDLFHSFHRRWNMSMYFSNHDFASVLSKVPSTLTPVATDGVKGFPVPSLPVIGWHDKVPSTSHSVITIHTHITIITTHTIIWDSLTDRVAMYNCTPRISRVRILAVYTIKYLPVISRLLITLPRSITTVTVRSTSLDISVHKWGPLVQSILLHYTYTMSDRLVNRGS